MVELAEPQHRNEVVVVGRLTGEPEPRTLPSGDEITAWRIVVDREGDGHDTLDCTAWTARLRRSAAGWGPGDVVEVEGALRRRFWRAPGGAPTSRYDIEVHAARRLARGTPATRRRRPG